MSFKRFLSTALAVAAAVAAMSVTTVFAGDPTFSVGNPIDITTSEEVTELTAGQVVEVPIDVENVDSGKLSGVQFHMYYDSTIFDPGASLTNTDVYTYYASYSSSYFNELDSTAMLIGRHNMKIDVLGNGLIVNPAGTFAGNLANTTSSPSVSMTWNITGADSIDVNDDEPEFYLLFTVKDDYDASTLGLNYGSQGLTNSGLFALDALYVDETTTINHSDLSGVQADTKLNACYGAFTVSVNNDTYATTYGNWITAVNANIYTDDTKETLIGTYTLDEYVTDDDTVYSFPTRITASSAYTSAYVEIVATTNSQEDGSGTEGTLTLGAKTISLDSSVTDYE